METQIHQTTSTAIRPFHFNVPEEELTDLRRRITATRWPERETVADWKGPTMTQAAHNTGSLTVVLVHGAFADAQAGPA